VGKLKILVTGKQGQLGYALQELSENQFEFTWKFTDRSELDITNSINTQSVLKKFQPDWIINTAAYTDVDGAENNQKIAYNVNADGPYILAKSAKEIGAKLVHISTDYVFDGTKNEPYTETDKPNPLQVYGKSKLYGETLIQKTGVSGIIIRTSWLYGNHGNNFVKTILRLAEQKDEIQVVDDQIGSPTYVGDLAETIFKLFSESIENIHEILHFSNEGRISWFEFAQQIIKISLNVCKIIPIDSKDLIQIAPRPKYSILDNNKIIKQYEVTQKNWKDSLNKYVKSIID